MGLFKRDIWRIEDVPPIRLHQLHHEIDIGFLGGDDHRQAFAALFCRAFGDNHAIIGEAELVEIRAERSAALAKLVPLPLAPSEREALAFRLYDSHNEWVELVLQTPSGLAVLSVTFDNPSFCLQPFAV